MLLTPLLQRLEHLPVQQCATQPFQGFPGSTLASPDPVLQAAKHRAVVAPDDGAASNLSIRRHSPADFASTVHPGPSPGRAAVAPRVGSLSSRGGSRTETTRPRTSPTACVRRGAMVFLSRDDPPFVGRAIGVWRGVLRLVWGSFQIAKKPRQIVSERHRGPVSKTGGDVVRFGLIDRRIARRGDIGSAPFIPAPASSWEDRAPLNGRAPEAVGVARSW